MRTVGTSLMLLMLGAAVTQAQVGTELTPSTWRDKYPSPRLELLRSRIASGQTDTDAFWHEVAQKGTPLVESFGKHTQHQLVTFLWRGSSATRNVLVEFYPYTWERAEDYVMRRIVNTDVWYLSLRLPSGARFAYRLSPNDPLNNPSFGVLRNTSFQSDPLNPKRWLCGPTAPATSCRSMVELPGAVAQPWIVRNPATPTGKVDKHSLKSELLRNERSVSVYTPPGYTTSTRYPLVVLFDGGAYLSTVPTPVILDNLIAASRLPPLIAVLVSNPPGARESELLYNRDFVDFLAKELIPWMRAHYSVTRDPRQTLIGGASAGGVAAAYAGLLYPRIFGNILAQSGGFNSSPEQMRDWAERSPAANPYEDRHVQEEVEDRSLIEGGWLAKQFIQSTKLPLKFYLDAGVFEASLGGFIGTLDASRHMRDVLLAKGYEVHYQEFIGGHDYLSWRGTLADGLIALIGKK